MVAIVRRAEQGRLHVHHRKPGINDLDWLITVCAPAMPGCSPQLPFGLVPGARL
jgi:hypothetical protein